MVPAHLLHIVRQELDPAVLLIPLALVLGIDISVVSVLFEIFYGRLIVNALILVASRFPGISVMS